MANKSITLNDNEPNEHNPELITNVTMPIMKTPTVGHISYLASTSMNTSLSTNTLNTSVAN